ncbi:hypothetical protein F4677DRAFT_263926 [Hypoxylon crocopeplum]|nr:hypothetical protein F4677DRAFT_263926 [Hypoxylon crocopeplum]
MVKTATVIQSNALFANQGLEGVVCVFAGATSGIGAQTLKRAATMFRSATFYVLGRSSARFERDQRPVLDAAKSPGCRIVFVEAELSLIAGVDDASRQIAAAETKVDYLFMSMGTGVPINGAEYTPEGLEVCFALSYYTRIRLLSNLLPLLRQSPRPRVLSVLNGGREQSINERDLGLEQPGSWSTFGAIKHTTLMTSLAFDYLAASNPQVTFLHNYPSLVKTDNSRKKQATGLVWKIIVMVLKGIVAVLRLFMGMSPTEAGERQAYHLTSDAYGPGSWRVSQGGDIVSDNAALKDYQERGWADQIWEFTLRTWDKALAGGDGGGVTK